MNSKRTILWTAIALLLLSTMTVIAFANRSFAQPANQLSTGIDLQGYMDQDVYFSQTDFTAEFRPGCLSTAALLQLDKEHYELRLTEGGPCAGRMSIWELMIDKDGNVSGEAWATMINPQPETGTMLGQWWLHTGCPMTGVDPLFPGVTGTWDGETLQVDVRFSGRCTGGTVWSNPEFWSIAFGIDTANDSVLVDGLNWDDGPVTVRYGGQFTVAD